MDVDMTEAGASVELSLETLPEPGVFGLQFEAVPGGARLVAVHPTGPLVGVAFPGDILQSVDGADLAGQSRPEMLEALEGRPGEVSQWKILRADRVLDLEVERVPASEL
jgi:C-terminal processing protease CtpA/Prc